MNNKYYSLKIKAENPLTDIYISDYNGFFVAKDTFKIEISLKPGDYIVSFSLKTGNKFLIRLDKDSVYDESYIRKTQKPLDDNEIHMRLIKCVVKMNENF